MDKRLPQAQGDPGEANLWPFGFALLAGFVAALVGLVGLAWLALALLHFPKVSHPGAISVHDTVGVFQLVFASVAGAGALVALIVAYRRQKVAESAATLNLVNAQLERTRVYNERFTAASAQIGDERPAIRLAGVHAMAGLADDWPENRQTCIDVLCAYLRMPYKADPGYLDDREEQLAFRASREVRHTVIRVIAAHLKETAAVSWQGLTFDFWGVVFDGGDFRGAKFSSGRVDFYGAEFSGGTVNFTDAEFSDAKVDFSGVKFSGGQVWFTRAEFSGGQVDFRGAEFSGGRVDFAAARFSGSEVDFRSAKFSGTAVYFGGAEFSGGQMHFDGAEFSGGEVDLGGVSFDGAKVSFYNASFDGAKVNFGVASFSGGEVQFFNAKFSSGVVDFSAKSAGVADLAGARFSGAKVNFRGARFSGAKVDFTDTLFSGGQVDFSDPRDWSVPPEFPWTDTPPPSVMLPEKKDQSRT